MVCVRWSARWRSRRDKMDGRDVRRPFTVRAISSARLLVLESKDCKVPKPAPAPTSAKEVFRPSFTRPWACWALGSTMPPLGTLWPRGRYSSSAPTAHEPPNIFSVRRLEASLEPASSSSAGSSSSSSETTAAHYFFERRLEEPASGSGEIESSSGETGSGSSEAASGSGDITRPRRVDD